jgi:hypothetical protein
LQDHAARTAKLRSLADPMWGACDGVTVKENTHGKGTVVQGMTVRKWLESKSISPDFSCADPESARRLDFIHRQTADADIYFVRNTALEAVKSDALFRIADRGARLWDPGDGRMSPAPATLTNDGRSRVTLDLPPGGSIFVVFSGKPADIAARLPDGKSTAIDGPWNVTFDPSLGGPSSVVFSRLISWTDHTDAGVKFYSGTGTYQRSLEIPAASLEAGRRVQLDLGDVREVAEVFLNGRSAGIVWKPPFRVDLTGIAKPGANDLKIEVMNLWCNRLAGDAELPPGKRITRTNISKNGTLGKPEPWKAQPSGLLGPVRLISSGE